MVTTVVRNDTKFTLQFTLKDLDSNPIDLTNNSAVIFKMALPSSSANKIESACTVTDATNGVCTYTTVAADFNTIGNYEAEIQATFVDGKILTAKLDNFLVISDLP